MNNSISLYSVHTGFVCFSTCVVFLSAVSFMCFFWMFLLWDLGSSWPDFILISAPLSGERCHCYKRVCDTCTMGTKWPHKDGNIEIVVLMETCVCACACARYDGVILFICHFSGTRGLCVVWLWCLFFHLWFTWPHWSEEVSYAGRRPSSTASSFCWEWLIY